MGAWSAKTNVAGQWIQVDIASVAVVTRVATQGRQDASQWVTSYYLEYRANTAHYTSYDNRKIFSGNRDRTSVVTHNLNPPIIEYFTVCDLSPCQNGGSCNEQGGVHTCNCTYYFYGANCEKGCNVTPPVGMENGAISNSSITASTEYSSNFAAWSGRLRHLWSSWSPSTGRAGEWLQVDLGKTINVTGTVATLIYLTIRHVQVEWTTS
ncbi:Coagulation factor VIII [Exaiptasia diaphana]|nr:Coagulation factor VIII [Exaiptasia diaphana]